MYSVDPQLIIARTPDGGRVFGLTTDQYHGLIRHGLIEEGAPIELLGGRLVLKDRSRRGDDPATVDPRHAWAVESLADLRPALHARGVTLRCQQPITIPPLSEPEPDGSVIVDRPDEYVRGHPRPADVFCAFEVADGSLDVDRTTKLRLYAAAGIPVYVIVNLPGRVLERYADPAADVGIYRTVEQIHPGGVLRIPIGDGQHLDVAADDLLPSS